MKRFSCLFVTLLLTAAAYAAPKVQLDAGGAYLTGLVPGREISWLGVVRVFDGSVAQLRVVRGVAAPTGGEFALDVEGDATCSVWSLVGIDDSLVAVRAGDRCISEESIEFSAPAGSDRIVVQSSLVVGQYVVPGDGIWRFGIRDGSELDGDGKINGQIEVVLAGMTPLLEDGLASPQIIEAGHRIQLLDPEQMRAAAAEVQP